RDPGLEDGPGQLMMLRVRGRDVDGVETAPLQHLLHRIAGVLDAVGRGELGGPLRGAGDDGDHAGRGGTMRGRRELAGDVPGGDHSPPQPGGGRRCGDGGVGKGQGRRRPVAARLVVLGHGSNLPSVPDTAVVSGTLWREVRRGRNRAPPAAIGRKRAPTAPEGYPFTEPAVMPRTRNRCREKNTIIGITIEMKAPAVRTSAPSPCVPSICCRFTMIV